MSCSPGFLPRQRGTSFLDPALGDLAGISTRSRDQARGPSSQPARYDLLARATVDHLRADLTLAPDDDVALLMQLLDSPEVRATVRSMFYTSALADPRPLDLAESAFTALWAAVGLADLSTLDSGSVFLALASADVPATAPDRRDWQPRRRRDARDRGSERTHRHGELRGSDACIARGREPVLMGAVRTSRERTCPRALPKCALHSRPRRPSSSQPCPVRITHESEREPLRPRRRCHVPGATWPGSRTRLGPPAARASGLPAMSGGDVWGSPGCAAVVILRCCSAGQVHTIRGIDDDQV